MEASGQDLTFEKHVRPILKAACFHCHGEAGEMKGGLDVRLVRLMIAGGESGSTVVPGDVDGSLLWKQIDSDEMPKGEKKLSAEEKALVRSWIAQGAKTERPEPADVKDARFTLEELEHWAFLPPSNVPIPSHAGESPIDGFVAARLESEGFGFSDRAAKRTLIRRLSFDMAGLPPTPESVEAFVEDASPNAYARLVDRLLASPQFGVRWGRHWLDTAGFAETDGGTDSSSDPKRPAAWRYRDYVIDAFNSNKPVNAFLREQLAGDELVEGDLDAYNARQRELLTATGFLRMAPDPTQGSDTLVDRNTAVAAAMQVVSTSVIGLTVGCAQCHDHKYDPIGIDDYYRFRAVFDPAFPLKNWQKPSSRLIDMTTAEVRAEAERIEAEAKVLEDDLNVRRDALGGTIQERKLADVPEEDRDATREAVLTESNKRTKKEKELLDLYPMVKPVRGIVGLLVEYDGPAYREFEKEQNVIAAIRAKKPPMRMIMATTEPSGEIPVSAVFFRGDPESVRESVAPAELMVLQRHGPKVDVPSNDAARSTTGRRLAYARHLTSGKHPLTARVFVNRLWQHHLGRGLVATPNDFGLAGERPSHTGLLDWLAKDLVRHDWDQKRLHRMILLSATYQQDSRRRPELDQLDPENRLLGRANLRRLEAEIVRDSLLAVTGHLNTSLGGPSIPVTEDSEGKAVIGVQKIRDGLRAGVDDGNADAYRRSAFVEAQRRLPLNVLATFDLPTMTPNCDLRRPTTVASQALWFLNDESIIQHAEHLAKGLATSHSVDPGARLNELYLRLFAQTPSTTELESLNNFLTEQQTLFAENAEHLALASLCQIMLASNRFLYVD
ncbi:MAG: hypothetical protein ACI9DF_001850 [Verrucomicrobiales bacterium]|jgi:hypothetical protein